MNHGDPETSHFSDKLHAKYEDRSDNRAGTKTYRADTNTRGSETPGYKTCGKPMTTKERRTEMSNPFCHVELASNDLPKAKEFYQNLFDWKLEDNQMGEMTYTMIQTGESVGGGMMKNPMPGAPSSWFAYVQVDDVRVATEKARELGANVCKEKTEVPGHGWFSIISAPDGSMLGLWQGMSD
jgi:predicted enzyme related to lactoylglutathione lyase